TAIEDGELVINVDWTPRTGVGLYNLRWRAQGDTSFQTAQTEQTEHKITDLPGAGNTLYPSTDLYPGEDVFPLPAVYEVGVYTVSPFGRSSAVNSVLVNV